MEASEPAPVRDTPAIPIAETDPGAVAGTSLRIVKYPNKTLRAPNAEVTEFGPQLQKLAREMFTIMYASRGVGLAAPQVGVNQRLMVFNPTGNERSWVSEVALVNPRIVARGPSAGAEAEGCLSFPGVIGAVERRKWVKVEAQRLNGKRFTVKFTDWTARVFQHEYDHLDGVLFIDHMGEAELAKNREVLDRLIRDTEQRERAL